MSIEDWRIRIDAIDRKLADLLNERVKCVIEVGRIKRQRRLEVFDPERERQVILQVLRDNPGPLDNDALRRIMERIIDECRRIEQQ